MHFTRPWLLFDLFPSQNISLCCVDTEQQAVGEHALLATPMGRSNVPEIPTAVVPPIVDVDAGWFPFSHSYAPYDELHPNWIHRRTQTCVLRFS